MDTYCRRRGLHVSYTFSDSHRLSRGKDGGTTHQPWRQGARSTSVQTTACGARAI